MQIWMVYETDLDTITLQGVFSTEDKALAYIAQRYEAYLKEHSQPKHDMFWCEPEEVQ